MLFQLIFPPSLTHQRTTRNNLFNNSSSTMPHDPNKQTSIHHFSPLCLLFACSLLQRITTKQPKQNFKEQIGRLIPYSYLKPPIQINHKPNLKAPTRSNQPLKPSFLNVKNFLFTTRPEDQYNFKTAKQNQTTFKTPPISILFSIKP
jgi:hypothetical protein